MEHRMAKDNVESPKQHMPKDNVVKDDSKSLLQYMAKNDVESPEQE